jgi:hypothetical protein
MFYDVECSCVLLTNLHSECMDYHHSHHKLGGVIAIPFERTLTLALVLMVQRVRIGKGVCQFFFI